MTSLRSGKLPKLLVAAGHLPADRIFRVEVDRHLLERSDLKFGLDARLYFVADSVKRRFVHRRLGKEDCLLCQVELVDFFARFDDDRRSVGMADQSDNFGMIFFPEDDNLVTVVVKFSDTFLDFCYDRARCVDEFDAELFRPAKRLRRFSMRANENFRILDILQLRKRILSKALSLPAARSRSGYE